MVEIYSAGDPGLVLDDEFTKFLPPLTEEERTQLAEDIKVHGCLSPLIVWRKGILYPPTKPQLEFKAWVEKQLAVSTTA